MPPGAGRQVCEPAESRPCTVEGTAPAPPPAFLLTVASDPSEGVLQQRRAL